MNKYNIRINEFQATLLRTAVSHLIEAKGIDRKENYHTRQDTSSLAAAELILLESMLRQSGSGFIGLLTNGVFNDFTG